jgi:hypothetical protein
MAFKPGQSGNPSGRPAGSKNKSTRKADEAFELVFDAMQENDTTSLLAWAQLNPTEFYKLFAKKLTTASDNHNHVVTESVTEEQARSMAEAFIESSRNRVGEGKPGCLHDSVSPGLPSEPATP